PSGQPLLALVREAGGLSWSLVQPLLVQVLVEIEAGLAAGDLPPQLSLDRLWVDDWGQLKLLDFAPAAPEPGAISWPNAEWRDFVAACARLAIEADSSDPASAPPRQAKSLLQKLCDPSLSPADLANLRAQLETLPSGLVPVSRSVRFAHLVVGQFV